MNIAVELLTDAFQDAFDTALRISPDSDLSGPVATVRRLFADKPVVVAFPPGRYSTQLDGLSSASIHIGRGTLAKSRLPGDGHQTGWRYPAPSVEVDMTHPAFVR